MEIHVFFLSLLKFQHHNFFAAIICIKYFFKFGFCGDTDLSLDLYVNEISRDFGSTSLISLFETPMSKLLPLAVYSATVISIVCLVSQFHPNIQMAQSDQHSRLWKSTSMEEAALKKLDLSWIQYGKEKSDWALLVNSWLCVQGKPDSGGRVKPRGEKELIIYSEQDFNLTKVSGNFNSILLCPVSLTNHRVFYRLDLDIGKLSKLA